MQNLDLRRGQRGFAGSAMRVLLALSVLFSSLDSKAETSNSISNLNSPSSDEQSSGEDSSYVSNPIDSYRDGALAIFDSKGKWILLGAAGAVATARIFDKQMQATFNKKNRFGELESLGNNYFGTGLPGTILGGGLWAYGNLAGKQHERAAGQAEIEALLATQLIVSGIKYAVHRERPDGSDNLSFPSGHNALAWTTAAVVHEFYGWKWGAVGYATGLITMASRMGANKHWFSDTVGGAAAGIIIGGAIARAHRKKLEAAEAAGKPSYSIQPQFREGAPGVMLTVSF